MKSTCIKAMKELTFKQNKRIKGIHGFLWMSWLFKLLNHVDPTCFIGTSIFQSLKNFLSFIDFLLLQALGKIKMKTQKTRNMDAHKGVWSCLSIRACGACVLPSHSSSALGDQFENRSSWVGPCLGQVQASRSLVNCSALFLCCLDQLDPFGLDQMA